MIVSYWKDCIGCCKVHSIVCSNVGKQNLWNVYCRGWRVAYTFRYVDESLIFLYTRIPINVLLVFLRLINFSKYKIDTDQNRIHIYLIRTTKISRHSNKFPSFDSSSSKFLPLLPRFEYARCFLNTLHVGL